jgi:hypothetical protein
MLSGDMAMVFNAPFNNISVISWRSALMLEENGNVYGDLKTKAKLLNSQFSSVFSTDNTSNIPDLRTSQYNEAPHITVTQNGVYKLLHGLNQHKATGPNEISTKFLKEMAAPVTPALTLTS